MFPSRKHLPLWQHHQWLQTCQFLFPSHPAGHSKTLLMRCCHLIVLHVHQRSSGQSHPQTAALQGYRHPSTGPTDLPEPSPVRPSLRSHLLHWRMSRSYHPHRMQLHLPRSSPALLPCPSTYRMLRTSDSSVLLHQVRMQYLLRYP